MGTKDPVCVCVFTTKLSSEKQFFDSEAMIAHGIEIIQACTNQFKISYLLFDSISFEMRYKILSIVYAMNFAISISVYINESFDGKNAMLTILAGPVIISYIILAGSILGSDGSIFQFTSSNSFITWIYKILCVLCYSLFAVVGPLIVVVLYFESIIPGQNQFKLHFYIN